MKTATLINKHREYVKLSKDRHTAWLMRGHKALARIPLEKDFRDCPLWAREAVGRDWNRLKMACKMHGTYVPVLFLNHKGMEVDWFLPF